MTTGIRFLLAWGLAGLVFHGATATAADAPRSSPDPALVQIQSVEVVVSQIGPVVLLRARNRAIPVFVDAVVAQSIQGALTGQKPPRPLSHDLMHNVLDAFGGKVTQVVVTLKGQTFYGALTVVVQGTTKVFDSRSSDAIALAIHFKAPVLVSQELLDSAGVELEKPAGVRL